jgi:hypothetical protein
MILNKKEVMVNLQNYLSKRIGAADLLGLVDGFERTWGIILASDGEVFVGNETEGTVRQYLGGRTSMLLSCEIKHCDSSELFNFVVGLVKKDMQDDLLGALNKVEDFEYDINGYSSVAEEVESALGADAAEDLRRELVKVILNSIDSNIDEELAVFDDLCVAGQT